MNPDFETSRPPAYRVKRRPACPDCLPANDNDNPSALVRRRAGPPSTETLNAALRYFSQHGLGAAGNAADEAVAARECGDEAAYAHWLAICRTLDPGAAKRIDDERTRRQ